jgi:tRNA (guanine37-N1)-methyltransferase
MKVPDVLLSGDHKKIALYRLKEAIRSTYKKRPDLLESVKLNNIEKKLLKEVIEEENKK